jgi:hypothetical protein
MPAKHSLDKPEKRSSTPSFVHPPRLLRKRTLQRNTLFNCFFQDKPTFSRKTEALHPKTDGSAHQACKEKTRSISRLNQVLDRFPRTL